MRKTAALSSVVPPPNKAPVTPVARRTRVLPPARSPERLDILHITAECWPFARTGGLGEAVAGLAASQAASGNRVTVVMPLYRAVLQSEADLEAVGSSFSVPVGSVAERVQLYRTIPRPGKPRMFFIAHAPSFEREGIYGEGGHDYPDNARRFALFCAAVLHAIPRIAPGVRVVHAHDWHAALALAYMGGIRGSCCDDDGCVLRVLSVHNAGFQGSFAPETITDVGLPGELFNLRSFESFGRMNFLKGALACCDLAVTVSPNHAQELRTREGGFGLHDTFAALGERLVGVTNGIDSASWDPVTDAMLPRRYSAEEPAGKTQCKAALQRACGLAEDPSSPLFAMCTRLAHQKGFDLILEADLLANTDGQFVFVGRGEARYERALAELAAAAPRRVALRLDFTDELEHRLLAGADALLMPSLYEPCGLTQLRAQRYGAIPIGRRVGGLADTIEDGVTGFLFGEYTREAFLACVQLASARYADKETWTTLMRRAMGQHFGWDRAAESYLALYRGALQTTESTVTSPRRRVSAGG